MIAARPSRSQCNCIAITLLDEYLEWEIAKTNDSNKLLSRISTLTTSLFSTTPYQTLTFRLSLVLLHNCITFKSYKVFVIQIYTTNALLCSSYLCNYYNCNRPIQYRWVLYWQDSHISYRFNSLSDCYFSSQILTAYIIRSCCLIVLNWYVLFNC